MSSQLDAIVEAAHSKDSKERLRAVQDAQALVDDGGATTENVPMLVDALQPAMRDTNPKVAQGALALLLTLAESFDDQFAPYCAALWAPLIERFGDAKVHMRDRAVVLAVGIGTLCVSTAEAIERLKPAFDHKNWRVRESAFLCLARTLSATDAPGDLREGAEYGGPSRDGRIPVRPLVPLAAKQLEDRQPEVREAASYALEAIHRLAGETMLADLGRMNIRPAVLAPFYERVGASMPPPPLSANNSGSLGGSSRSINSGRSGRADDEPAPASSRRAPSPKRRVGASPRVNATRAPADGDDAGASGVAAVHVYSDRDLAREMEVVGVQLRNDSEWAVRQALAEIPPRFRRDYSEWAVRQAVARTLITRQSRPCHEGRLLWLNTP